MAEAKIQIAGMSCQHCVMAVKKAIGGLKGIEESDISIGSAAVKFDDKAVRKEELETAIEKAGFQVERGLA
jgi:copper chaperone